VSHRAYLVADIRPGLHGLGGAFFILLFDPTSPDGSVLDVAPPVPWAPGGAFPPPALLATQLL
jgi:hypothetical protein